MNLFQASRQWAMRPDDERFSTLKAMRNVCYDYHTVAKTSAAMLKSFQVAEAPGNDLVLVGKTGAQASFTHWAYGQFCQRVGAPADFMRKLPAHLAQDTLNYQLSQQSDRKMQLMFHQNGGLILRAFTGSVYSRIWNYQICDYLTELESIGWRIPPARPVRTGQRGTRQATETDVLRAGEFGLSVKVGDLIAPAGLYASDHDMFAFMVDNEHRISDGTDSGLGRGFFVENSEVGDGAFVITTFLYRHVCGNHIVWDASGVKEIRIRHTGEADGKARHQLTAAVREYADSSASDIEAQIKTARTYQIAATQEETIEAIFRRGLGVGRQAISDAYESAVSNETENKAAPNTVWGMVNGLTDVSQRKPHGDERVKIDRAASKIMEIAF